RRRGGDRPRCHPAPGDGRGPRGRAGPQSRYPARAAGAGRPAPARPPLTTPATAMPARRPQHHDHGTAPSVRRAPATRLPLATHDVMIGPIMTVPIRSFAAGSGRADQGWAGQAGAIDAHALADLLGRWP